MTILKVENLLLELGRGELTTDSIGKKLFPKEEPKEKKTSFFTKYIKRARTGSGINVQGMDNMLIQFGKCCQPVPGDPITGYITRGFGVTVHRTRCVNALKMSPERQIDVEWHVDVEETYPVKIQVRSFDRVGLLADIASNISKNGANIISAKSETRGSKIVESSFTIAVEGTEHLKKILSSIRKVKHIQEVRRIDG